MVAKLDTASFEAALMKQLSHSNVSKDEIRSISQGLKPYFNEGILFERWKWKGTPRPDVFEVSGRVSVDKLSILNRLTLEDYIQSIILRKIGVIAINQIEFNIDIPMQGQ